MSEARRLLEKAMEYLPSDASVFYKIRAYLAQPISKCEGALSREQIEERRKNLTFIRENAPGDPVGDHLLTTTLLMQEEWLATVDALVAREGELVAALGEKA